MDEQWLSVLGDLFRKIIRITLVVAIVILSILGLLATEAVFTLRRWPLGNFWRQSRASFYDAVGTTQLGFFLALAATMATALVTAVLIFLVFGREKVKRHIKEGLLIAIGAALIVTPITYAPVFISKVAATIRENQEDSGSAHAQNKDLQGKLAENCKDDRQRADKAEAEAGLAKGEARRWLEVYQETTHGDLHPDRHLDREDRRKLREELEQIAKDPRNKDYIKLDFGMSPSIEASHLGWQIYRIFRETHWNLPVKIKTEYPKELQEYMQAFGPASYVSGIYIFSDDPYNRGQYLALILNSCCGLQVNVNPRGIPPKFKGTMLWVGNKWFTNWKDDD